jgi:hypothetical protein
MTDAPAISTPTKLESELQTTSTGTAIATEKKSEIKATQTIQESAPLLIPPKSEHPAPATTTTATPQTPPPASTPAPAPAPPHSPSQPKIYHKKNLPAYITSTYPHGLITNVPRSAKEQEAFDHRKSEVLRKFSLAQIQALYDEQAQKVNAMLAEDRRLNEDIEKKIEILTKQRDLERKLYLQMKGRRGGGKRSGGSAGGEDGEGGEAEGEEGTGNENENENDNEHQHQHQHERENGVGAGAGVVKVEADVDMVS